MDPRNPARPGRRQAVFFAPGSHRVLAGRSALLPDSAGNKYSEKIKFILRFAVTYVKIISVSVAIIAKGWWDAMKKGPWILILALISMLLLSSAALADTVTLSAIHATCEISSSYVLLTTENLSRHPEWMADHHTSEEEILADWNVRGVLLQAWTTSGDACLEITAVRDAVAVQIHDIDAQTPNYRATYRREHLSGSTYRDLGYRVDSAEWKRTGQGRFLMLKYSCTQNGTTWRGYARKTVKNGYTITLDYKVFGRRLAARDNTALNRVWDTWSFTESVTAADVAGLPQDNPGTASPSGIITTTEVTEAEAPAPTAHMRFTSVPPAETNSGKFTIEGTCDANMHLVGVCLRMDSSEPIIFQGDADRRGRFKLNIQLPNEGVWLVTLNAEQNGQVVEEQVFNVITYQSNLLIVNFNEELPVMMELHTDRLVISGTTVKQTTVQCVVDGGYNRQIRTNNSGKFSFTLDTSAPGTYHINLSFSKRNYAPRSFTCTATRSVNVTEMQGRAVEEAIHPAYATLNRRIQNYINRIMWYRMYVVSIDTTAGGWLVTMAQRITTDGYADLVVVSTTEEPQFEVGSQQVMYGTLTGTHLIQDSVNGDQYLPAFSLLFWGENGEAASES